MLVGSMVLDCLTKVESCDAARKYLQNKEVGMRRMDAEMYLEVNEVRAAWLDRDGEDLTQWLRRNGYYTHSPTRISRSMSRLRDALEFLGCM
ncbi:hypothetical protein VTL71DRAFT_10612 [Oculimacula yallundae]|uniref:Uncharacterized protein n=1 Tax=Oculimacula yallundae TaxID=86028 RepID=A0ABR4CU15_9HELO